MFLFCFFFFNFYFNLYHSSNKAPLHVAVIKNKNHALIALLHNKANPNVQDSDGFTPLHWAVQTKNANFVEKLIEFGANPNICDYEFVSSLSMAKALGLKNFVSIMERSHAPVPQEENFAGCRIFGFCIGTTSEAQMLPTKRELL